MPELPTITRLNNIGGLGAGFASPTIPDATLDLLLEESGYLNSAGYANQDSVGGNFKLATLSGPNPIFSRASGATFRGSNGLIQYAPENLLVNSNSAIGNYSVGTRTENYGDGPLPSTRSALISSTSASITYYVGYSAPGITLMDQNVCTSIYVKQNTAPTVGLSMHTGTNAGYTFTFATEQIVTGYSPRHVSSGVQKLNNGWYRIWFTIRLQNNDHWPIFSAQGSEIFGAQAERGVTSPRPYIPITNTVRYGPRFEYSTSGVQRGLLMEESSTNLLSYSEQFDIVSGGWGVSGVVVSANQTISPSGASSADRITCTAGAGYHGFFQSFTNKVNAGERATFSAYLKYESHRYVRFSFVTLGGADSVYVDVDLLNGVIVNAGPYGSATQVSQQIIDVGNGWYRVSVTGTLPSATNYAAIYFRDSASNANPEVNFQFTATGNEKIYIWGAQLEQKPFATSYIPTTNATATRSADVCLVGGGDFRRTNLLTYSEQFDNAAWSKIGLNTTGTPPWVNVISAPNGTQTADFLIEGGGTAVCAINQTSGTTIANTPYTFSVYAKKNQRSILQILFQDGQTNDYVNFDLDSGTIAAGTYTSASIINVGDGWYRCSITITVGTSIIIPYLKICNSPTMGRYASYTGTAGFGLYVWGAQLEVSSTFYENPSPYIPTTSSAVTVYDRFYNDTEGAILIQGDRNNVSTVGGAEFVNIGDGTASESMAINRYAGVEERFIVYSGTPQATLTLSPAVSANTMFAVAATYKLNDFSATENGDTPVTDTSGTIPIADRMEIGGRSGRELNGHIKKLRYYNKRISDINLKYLSSNFN